MRALLDVNVLLALLDVDHVDHARARRWLDEELEHGWASCALTQNGLVRILSQPRYPSPVSVTEAMARLQRATSTDHHLFWPCDVSALDPSTVDRRHLLGHRQITDAYLLAMAAAHGGRFVTLDRSVPVDAVPGATPDQLVVLV